MIRRDHERRVCGHADMNVWWSSNLLDPIKLKAVGVVQLNNRLLPLFQSHQLAMSLINNHTFEHSMGHQISHQDAHFHLHMSDGQHYPSNQQVRHRQDSTFTGGRGGVIQGVN